MHTAPLLYTDETVQIMTRSFCWFAASSDRWKTQHNFDQRNWLQSAARVVAIIIMFVTNPASSFAGKVKLLSSSGVKSPIIELAARFETETGHQLVVDYGDLAVLKKRIDTGEEFDVVILNPALIQQLIEAGKVDADTRGLLGRVGMGVAVRKGGPRPDIGTPDSFKRAMLGAKSVAYSSDGDSGKAFFSVLDRLGIRALMNPKVKPVKLITQAVADGDAELGFAGVGDILADRSVDLVGVLPSGLQSYVVYTLGASPAANDPVTTRALIEFLTGTTAASVLQKYGVESERR